jgi:acetyl-CoA C-acetyltransferase
LVRQAANQLTDGGDSVIITGGVENMSQTPVMDTDRMLMEEFAKGQMEKGGLKGKVIGWMLKRKLGKSKPYTNPLNEGLTDPKADIMIGTADKLAKLKGLTREQADAFAAESQKRAKAAVDGGRVKEEIRPVRQTDLQNGKLPKGVTEVAKDEHLRETNAQKLGKLKTIMTNKEDAIHTAGSSSGIVDGASAIVVSTGAMAKAKNLPILAKLKAVAVTGCDPKIMGFGPARAIPAALEAAGLKMEDISYVEVNEAFAGQAMAVQKALNIPDNKFNPDGGAIAFGHPLSATGGRITLHAAHRLKQDNAKYAVVSACIGGGQGIAMVLENPEA